MTTTFILSLILFIFQNEEPSSEQVIARDRELNLLIQTHEVEKAKEIYAEQFILTTSSGKAKSRQDVLQEIASPELRLTVNETTDVAVRMVDHTAVLTGILHQQGVYKGNAFDVFLYVTDTWVFTDGRWKLLAGHASPVKK